MCHFVLTAAIALVLTQTLPARAAVDIMQYESLDLAVAKADLVVRGEVIEVTSKKLDNGIVWSRVTVKVAEIVKGEKVKEVTFLVRESPLEPRPDTWRNMRDELLFCLNTVGGKEPEESPLRGDFVLRDGNVSWAILLNGAPGKSPVYGPDFKRLTAPKEILAAARGAAKAGKPGAMLGFVDDRLLRPCEVLYPDSEQVRAAAKKQGLDLRDIK